MEQIFDDKGVLIGLKKNNLALKIGKTKEVDEFIKKHHYSETVTACPVYRFFCYLDDQILGAITVGYPMNTFKTNCLWETQPPRGCFFELNRMCFIDNKPKNTESSFLSLVIKFLKLKNNKIWALQSFADERCQKKGVVYQASNFVYFGSHKSSFFLTPEGMKTKFFLHKSRGITEKRARELFKEFVFEQYRYIYFIDKTKRSLFKLKEKPFEKWSEMTDGK